MVIRTGAAAHILVLEGQHLSKHLPVPVPGALKEQQLEAAACLGVCGYDEALVDLPLCHSQLIEGCGSLVNLRGKAVSCATASGCTDWAGLQEAKAYQGSPASSLPGECS